MHRIHFVPASPSLLLIAHLTRTILHSFISSHSYSTSHILQISILKVTACHNHAVPDFSFLGTRQGTSPRFGMPQRRVKVLQAHCGDIVAQVWYSLIRNPYDKQITLLTSISRTINSEATPPPGLVAYPPTLSSSRNIIRLHEDPLSEWWPQGTAMSLLSFRLPPLTSALTSRSGMSLIVQSIKFFRKKQAWRSRGRKTGHGSRGLRI